MMNAKEQDEYLKHRNMYGNNFPFFPPPIDTPESKFNESIKSFVTNLPALIQLLAKGGILLSSVGLINITSSESVTLARHMLDTIEKKIKEKEVQQQETLTKKDFVVSGSGSGVVGVRAVGVGVGVDKNNNNHWPSYDHLEVEKKEKEKKERERNKCKNSYSLLKENRKKRKSKKRKSI